MKKVKIVTDSVADIPPEVAEELGITVIPLHVCFGEEVFRDGVDMTTEEFYRRLPQTKILPVTSVPPPAAFIEAYDKLAKQTDRILVITLTSKLSGVYEVARQSVEMKKRKCRIEVLDSQLATMAQGFVVIAAARAANDGLDLDEIIDITKRNIPRVEMHAAFDTLEYLRRGGRIGRAQALMGSMLSVKPIVTIKDGVVEPVAKVRSRSRAIDHLFKFAKSFAYIEEMALETTGRPEDAETLIDRLGDIFPREQIYRSNATPVIGTHTGPGLLLLAIMGDKRL